MRKVPLAHGGQQDFAFQNAVVENYDAKRVNSVSVQHKGA